MDYERALEALRFRLAETPRYGGFLVLESRLLDNLSKENVFGSTATRRSERSEIVYGLNELALDALRISFNDLAVGRVPPGRRKPHFVDREAEQLKAHVPATPVPPPVTPSLSKLPFEELTWKQFELLCLHLVGAQPDVHDAHLYGVGGDFQKGVDIVAIHVRAGQEEKWVYQCKRHKKFTAEKLRKALDEITYPADYYIVIIGCEASTKLRDVVSSRQSTFLWDALDLSRRLKNHPRIVEDFFGRSWRDAFNG